MELGVMIPAPAVDFNFDSGCTSPYVSAPSSPQRFGNFFYSALTSPTRAASFFHEFSLINPISTATATSADGPLFTIPFNWEEKPGVPKRKDNTDTINDDDEETDFAFDFSGQLERPSLSAADELFDGGKIKPLKPPPRLHISESRVSDSPRSPKSPKKMFKEVLSPRHKKKDFDPFSEAIKQTSREQTQQTPQIPQRGRERTYDSSNTSARHKATRSLSPFRASDMLFEGENDQKSSKESSTSSSTWYSKWKLKDLLLFRSASEGSARTSKDDPLKKYAMIKKVTSEDLKNSSFRSTDSGGSVGSSRRRRVSAHELHYTANRAVAEEMKRKTFLPYKQGLLGCLGFSHGVNELSRGLNSALSRQ